MFHTALLVFVIIGGISLIIENIKKISNEKDKEQKRKQKLLIITSVLGTILCTIGLILNF